MTPKLEATIRKAIAPLEGWCWPEKALAMADLILRVKPKVVVEIGVFGGRSLVPQAMALKEIGSGTAYGIDPWRKEDALEGFLSDADREWWSTVDLDLIHGGCMRAIWDAGVEAHCTIIRSNSRDCSHLFSGWIDVLHVDGTHSEQSSTRDVNLYIPKVPAGGHVFLDDANWSGVAKARSLLTDQCDLMESLERPGGGGLCLLFRKR